MWYGVVWYGCMITGVDVCMEHGERCWLWWKRAANMASCRPTKTSDSSNTVHTWPVSSHGFLFFLFFSFVAFSLSFSLSTFSFFLFSLFILNTLLTNPTMDRNNLWSIGTWTWTQTMDAVVWVWARTKTLSFLGIPSDDLPATHRNKNIVTKWRRSKEQRNKLASKHKVYAALKLKS